MPARFVNIDRDTPLLLPPNLKDWVPAYHLCLLIVDAVEELDLQLPRSRRAKFELFGLEFLENRRRRFSYEQAGVEVPQRLCRIWKRKTHPTCRKSDGLLVSRRLFLLFLELHDDAVGLKRREGGRVSVHD